MKQEAKTLECIGLHGEAATTQCVAEKNKVKVAVMLPRIGNTIHGTAMHEMFGGFEPHTITLTANEQYGYSYLRLRLFDQIATRIDECGYDVLNLKDVGANVFDLAFYFEVEFEVKPQETK